jgi:hypothetical protein
LNASVPELGLREAVLEEARMEIAARKAILASGDFLRAADVARLASLTAGHRTAGLNRWKREELIFAIRYKGDDYFPRYALDPAANYHPRRVVAEILRIFGHTKSAWGIAFWFATLNSRLHEHAPKDLLARDPQSVLPLPDTRLVRSSIAEAWRSLPRSSDASARKPVLTIGDSTSKWMARPCPACGTHLRLEPVPIF